jgi:hypothetical protein
MTLTVDGISAHATCLLAGLTTLMVVLSLATALLGEGFGRWIAAALAIAIGRCPSS